MKKLNFILSFLIITTMVMAQQNLREGYVITLQGDTLQGVIDFRTPAMNTKRCVFRQNGATEFTTFLPGEIDSYRFTNNGIYYVSMNISKEKDKREMVFAEYILRGNMNLYQIGADEMLLVNEDGNEAAFSLEEAKNAKDVNDLRNEIGDAWLMLSKSEKASNIIWKRDKNRDNTKKAVMTYIDDVCTDGFCEVFEYQSVVTPKEDRVIHPWVKVGYKATQYKFWNDKTLSGYAPQVSAGVDFHCDRLFKGLMFNIGITYEPGKAKGEKGEGEAYYEEVRKCEMMPLEVEFNQLNLMFGPGYQFRTGTLKTRVKCGGIYRPFFHKMNLMYDRYYHPRTQNVKWQIDTTYGLYAGVGLEYPLKKLSLIWDLEYIYNYNKWTTLKDSEKHVIHQNALCLSFGVKL